MFEKYHKPTWQDCYSITSVAAANNSGGTVRPSLLAVFRLMTSQTWLALNWKVRWLRPVEKPPDIPLIKLDLGHHRRIVRCR